jgi:phage shock protein PspC (stress-responsive transcriptional regulator)
VNDNFKEWLGVVVTLVLVVSLVNVMSMLFLVFTGTSTTIWIFAVPSWSHPQETDQSPVESALGGEAQL